MRDDKLAIRSGYNETGTPVKQAQTDGFLKRGNAATECRLGQVGTLGCAREMQFICEQNKVLEMPQVDARVHDDSSVMLHFMHRMVSNNAIYTLQWQG